MSAPLLQNVQNFFHQIALQAEFISSIFFYALVFNLFNWFLLGSHLNKLGIIPRKFFGIFGIFFSPILHGDFKHYIFNALPFAALILFSLTLLSPVEFLANFLTMHLLSFVLIWCFARPGIHIGASGLICALYGWILTLTFFEPNGLNILILFIMLLYFGGVLMSLFPTQPGVSWEGHLLGFISGIITYFLYSSSLKKSMIGLAVLFQNFITPLLETMDNLIGVF